MSESELWRRKRWSRRWWRSSEAGFNCWPGGDCGDHDADDDDNDSDDDDNYLESDDDNYLESDYDHLD